MRNLPRLICLALLLSAIGCGNARRPHELDGRWAVRLRLEENRSPRDRPLAREIDGILVFHRAVPRLPGGTLGIEAPRSHASGCAFVARELFHGHARDARHASPDSAGWCVALIGYRYARDSVLIAISPEVIDAGTYLHGVRRGDTIAGRWTDGSEGVAQRGRATFRMWRLAGPPGQNFFRLAGTLRRDRMRFRILTAANGIFLPPPEQQRWLAGGAMLLALAPAVPLLVRARRSRRTLPAMAVLLAAAAAEVLLYLGGGAVMRAVAHRWPVEPVAPPAGPVLLVLAAMFLLGPLAAWLLLRRVTRRSGPVL